jgi:hypothetical protein
MRRRRPFHHRRSCHGYDAGHQGRGKKLKGAFAALSGIGAGEGRFASDGGAFLIGDDEVAENPRITTPRPFIEFVQIWFACRAGMGGYATWPDAGGVADQAAWVFDAFRTLGGIEAEMDAAKKRRRGSE